MMLPLILMNWLSLNLPTNPAYQYWGNDQSNESRGARKNLIFLGLRFLMHVSLAWFLTPDAKLADADADASGGGDSEFYIFKGKKIWTRIKIFGHNYVGYPTLRNGLTLRDQWSWRNFHISVSSSQQSRAGRHGPVVRVLSSGDRLCGLKSWPRQSVFLLAFFFLLLLLSFCLSPLCALSLTMLVGMCICVFYDSLQGRRKVRNHRKILTVPFLRRTRK